MTTHNAIHLLPPHKNQRKKFTIPLGGHPLTLGEKTCLMGILNITPDSFSQDGTLAKYGYDARKNVTLAQKLLREGADIIDIGGESTRPHAQPVGVKEEIKRVIPTIRALAKKISAPISIDTYKEIVARYALDSGASIVNNIRGTKVSKKFLKVLRSYDAVIILMHMRATPRTMQAKTTYQNLLGEIISELQKSIEKCLEAGIKSDRIIIDPGIGFAKTSDQNLEILNRLEEFQILQRPILVGASRKSFIGKILNCDTDRRIFGSVAAAVVSVLHGAHILRIHDIKATHEAIQITDAILNTYQKKVNN